MLNGQPLSIYNQLLAQDYGPSAPLPTFNQFTQSPTYSALSSAANIGSLGNAPKIEGLLGMAFANMIAPQLFQSTTDDTNDPNSFENQFKNAYQTATNNQAQATQNHPIASLAGGLLGGAALPFNSSSLLGDIGLGSLYGAGYGLGSSDVYGNLSDAAKNVAINAPIGGITAGTLSGLGSALGGTLSGLEGAYTKLLNPSDIRSVADQVADETGASSIPDANNLLNGNAAPNSQQAILNTAKQFSNFPLTVGQATRDPATLALEDAMASGVYGGTNAHLMQNYRANVQNPKFIQEGRNLRNDLGKGTFTEPNDAVTPLVESLQSDADTLKAQKNEAYANAGDALIDKNAFAGFPDEVAQNLNDAWLTPNNTPGAYSQLKAFQDVINKNTDQGISFGKLEGFRQGLNKFTSSNQQDMFAKNIILDALDNKMNDALSNNILSGDPETLANVQKARGLASDYFNQFTTKNENGPGQKFITDMVNNADSSEPYTNQQIVDKLFGSNPNGFDHATPQRIGAIANRYGTTSPEFQGVKMEAANRILNPLLANANKGNVSVGAPAVQTYKNNLNANMPVIKSVFNPDEIAKLQSYGDLGSAVYQLPRSSFNPSQTEVLRNLLNKVETVPVVGEIGTVGKAVQNIGKANQYINQTPEALANAIQKINTTQDFQSGQRGFFNKALNPNFANGNANPARFVSSGLPNNAALNLESRLNTTRQAQAAIPQKNFQDMLDPSLRNMSEIPNLQNLSDKDLDNMIQQQELQKLPDDELDKKIQEMEGTGAQTPTLQKQSEPISQTQPKDNLLDKIAKVESNNNPNAKSPNSTASGLLQFTNSTWKSAVDKYGAQNGITYADKNDPSAQRTIAASMLNDNANALKATLRRNPSEGEVYMTHFLGLGDAIKLLNSPANAPAFSILPQAAKANRSIFFKGSTPRTAKQVYDVLNTKINNI